MGHNWDIARPDPSGSLLQWMDLSPCTSICLPKGTTERNHRRAPPGVKQWKSKNWTGQSPFQELDGNLTPRGLQILPTPKVSLPKAQPYWAFPALPTLALPDRTFSRQHPRTSVPLKKQSMGQREQKLRRARSCWAGVPCPRLPLPCSRAAAIPSGSCSLPSFPRSSWGEPPPSWDVPSGITLHMGFPFGTLPLQWAAAAFPQGEESTHGS